MKKLPPLPPEPPLCYLSRLSPRNDQVLIAFNPNSGSQKTSDESFAGLKKLVQLLDKRSIKAEIVTDLEEISKRSKRLFKQGILRTVVAAGGDGTAAEIVNRTGGVMPVTIYPSGNENLLARYLRASRDPDVVAEIIADGTIRRFDAGYVRWEDHIEEKRKGRIFLLMLGAGFDAEVCRRLQEKRTGHISSRDYLHHIYTAGRKYNFPEIRFRQDTLPTAREAPINEIIPPFRWLFCHNMPMYGGDLITLPNANPIDGKLDLCVFEKGGKSSLLLNAFSTAFRLNTKRKDCHIFQAGQFFLESDEPVPFQLDGDMLGYLPISARILRGGFCTLEKL